MSQLRHVSAGAQQNHARARGRGYEGTLGGDDTGPGVWRHMRGHCLILQLYSGISAQSVQYVRTKYREIVLKSVNRGGERGAIAGTAQTSGHVHI